MIRVAYYVLIALRTSFDSFTVFPASIPTFSLLPLGVQTLEYIISDF